MNKIAIPCTCGCGIALVTEFDRFGEDPQEFFVEFFTSLHTNTRKSRLQAAWRVLRGKDPWIHDVNFGPNEMWELKEFLDMTLPRP